MPEKRICPVINLSEEERAQYDYSSHLKVSLLLSDFGYGPSTRLIQAFYLSPDKKIGVGVLPVTEPLCEDHFGVTRGIDLVESIAQTFVLLHQHTAKNQFGRPMFKGISWATFDGIATLGAILNVVVQRDDLVETTKGEIPRFGGYGWVLRSKRVLTEGEIYGSFTEPGAIDSLIKRAEILQGREQVLFPLK